MRNCPPSLLGPLVGDLSKRLSRGSLGSALLLPGSCFQEQDHHHRRVGREAECISVSLCTLARKLCQPLWRVRLTCWGQAELGTTPEVHPGLFCVCVVYMEQLFGPK